MKNVTTKDLKIASIVIGFVATLMIFLPALSLSANGSANTYTGLQVVFGHEFFDLGGFGSGEIRFCLLNLIAYSLPLLAALSLMFTKAGHIVSTIMFAVAAILLFLVIEFTVVTVTIGDVVTEIDIDWNYAIGLILAAVLSILGFVVGVLSVSKKA